MTAEEYLFQKLKEKNLALLIIKGSRYANELVDIMESYAKLKQKQPKKSLEERQRNFIASIAPFIEQYGKPMCMAFYNYWSETNKQGKMRFELQKTWEVGKRLTTWHNNQKSFNNGKQDKRTELDNLEQQLIAKFGG